MKGSKKKGKKGEKSTKILVGAGGVEEVHVEAKLAAKKSDWGLLEPLHDILSPLFDIVSPLMPSGNILYGLLFGLLIAYWFRGSSSNVGNAGGRMTFLAATPERIAAYEEIWRREESELWDWLEERVGMERRGGVGGGSLDIGRGLEERLDGLGLGGGSTSSEREIESAIRVTEEKLRALKGVVEKRKGEKGKEKERSRKVEERKAEL